MLELSNGDQLNLFADKKLRFLRTLYKGVWVKARRSFNTTEKMCDCKPQQGRKHGYISQVRLGRGSIKFIQATKQQNTKLELDVTDGQTDQQTWRLIESLERDKNDSNVEMI